MNNIRKISIEIETIKSGQPRPHADSEYDYILKVEGMTKFEAERYCTTILKPRKQSYQEWLERSNDSADAYFGGYYKFEMIGDDKYRYYVLIPYCD